jgi:hypothetical protein
VTFPLALFGLWKLLHDWQQYQKDRAENRLPAGVLAAERLRFRGVAAMFASALVLGGAVINPTSPDWLFWVLGAFVALGVLAMFAGSFLSGWRRG